MFISSAFDAGNIEVLEATQPDNVRLRIRKDIGEDHYQWFYFRVTGAKGQNLNLRIENAGEASFPKGWDGYQVCWSTDRKEWLRAETSFDGQALSINFTPSTNSVWLAYFAPYSLERHADLVAYALSCGAEYERIGTTVQGRDLDLLKVGNLKQGRPLWIIARQHPGESMAEWLMEGLIEHLLDQSHPVARKLREMGGFYLVPNMNPDGSILGQLRNNAAGANLNREWAKPTLDRSPEVLAVQEKMQQTGVKFFLDVHGDEALPYNFIAGAEGTPSWTADSAQRQKGFIEALMLQSPDFQNRYGYPVAPAGRANLSMATNWVGETYKCLSMTLEQPFKDTDNHPHPHGWSPSRAKRLGEAILSAIYSEWASLA